MGESRRAMLHALTLGFAGTRDSPGFVTVVCHFLARWPTRPLGNSPEFPNFLIYKMGTVLYLPYKCDHQMTGIGLTWEALSVPQGSCHKGLQGAVQ